MDVWFEILKYLKVVEIIRLLFVSRRLNEIIFSSKQYKKYRNLSNLVVDKNKLYDCFKQRYNELIDRLTFSFSFIDCLYFIHRLEILKNKFCITNALCHFLFSSRCPVSVGQCRVCSRLFVKDADVFVSSVKYHFPHIFVTNVFNSNKDIEYLFAKQRKRIFKLDILYSSEKHYKLNRIVV